MAEGGEGENALATCNTTLDFGMAQLLHSDKEEMDSTVSPDESCWCCSSVVKVIIEKQPSSVVRDQKRSVPFVSKTGSVTVECIPTWKAWRPRK